LVKLLNPLRVIIQSLLPISEWLSIFRDEVDHGHFDLVDWILAIPRSKLCCARIAVQSGKPSDD
jgi:hypothetical protein